MEKLDPISRIEFFLDAVLNGDPAPYDPQTRSEFYLAYLCGSAVTLPTPQSRVDFYLAYKCGEDVEIPDPIERIDFYLAKWCGYDCETPDPIHPIEYYLNALANSGELKTVTGNPISVSDALAKPAESLTIEILPQQDLHGYANPWPAGGGKNKIGLSRTEGTPTPADLLVTPRLMDTGKYYAGLRSDNYYYPNYVTSFSVTDTTVKVTSANNTRYGVAFPVACAASSQYTISATLTGALISVGAYDASWNFLSQVIGPNSEPPLTITTPADATYITIIISSQTLGVEGTATNIQLELGSTATTFAPYSNICPISGHDSVKVWVKPTYDPTANPTATIQLGQTVYGGTLDVTTGVLTVDRLLFTANTATMNNSEDYPGWRPAGVKANGAKGGTFNSGITNVGFGYGINVSGTNDILYMPKQLYNQRTESEWIALATDVQIVYELATPQTIQLTPTEIEMLLGNNVIWNDVGDMVLEYLADGPADDIDALNILLNNRYVNNGGEDEATDREALEILLGGNTR